MPDGEIDVAWPGGVPAVKLNGADHGPYEDDDNALTHHVWYPGFKVEDVAVHVVEQEGETTSLIRLVDPSFT